MGKHLHFDCFSGISGDMTLAALLDAGVPRDVIENALESLGLGGKLVVETVRKAGFAATHVRVEAPHEHAHRHLSDIYRILDAGNLTPGADERARRMFRRLAEAEAASHGISVEKVHFHEVGAIDSIFDFVGVAVGLDWLAPDRISARPVPTGTGFVDCEHGRLPVPAPAVARLLIGVPLAVTNIDGELTTPTGAAILSCFVDEYTLLAPSRLSAIGVGAGSKDLEEQANILRILIGSTESSTESFTDSETDQVWLVETNLDDVAPEIIGYCCERLFEVGALDAYATPIQMKKNRPAVLLAALCGDADLAAVERTILRETGAFGLRKRLVLRTKLRRRSAEVETPWGTVRGKIGWNAETKIFTPEFEDCARLAREKDVPLREVYQEAERRFFEKRDEPIE